MSAPLIHGRLAADEKAKIEHLAGRGLKASQIALRMNRHKSTINFAMHGMGLKAPLDRQPITFTRKNGSIVYSFTPDEDAMVEALRAEGAVCREIAAECLARFGRKRSAATIGFRLRMLANKVEATQ